MNQLGLFQSRPEPSKNSSQDLYCFLDLETTGFDPKEDSIIEISFILTGADLVEISRFDKVILPYRSALSPEVTRITGITQAEIDQNGTPWEAVQAEIQELIGGTVIIGHNIDFDIRFLLENGIHLNPDKRIDTHELARIFLIQEESYALEVLSTTYGFLHTDAHRAMSDVEASKDLFAMMLQKIEEISPELKQLFQDVVGNQPHWYAKDIILASKALNNKENPFKEKEEEVFELVDLSLFQAPCNSVRITESNHAARWTRDLCNSFAKSGEKSLIITSKIPFFSEIKSVPIPEILLDEEKLMDWGKEKRTNNQVAFLLKCLHRMHYGFKDVFAMDLYFDERSYWKEVSLQKDEDPRFLKVLESLETELVLCLSPNAYARFYNHKTLKGRTLIVDEAELVAQDFMEASVKTYRFLPYLDDETTTVAAQFFVRNICQELIEPLLGKKAGPYPERILFPSNAFYPRLSQQISEIGNDATLMAIKKMLSESYEGCERWLIYYPDSSDISFHTWDREDWESLKDHFKGQKVILLHRHVPDVRNMFFAHFFNLSEIKAVEISSLVRMPKLVVPKNLESQKSEAFIPFCEDFVKTYTDQFVSENHWLGVHVSSLETLKKVFEPVYRNYENTNVSVKGEKMSGGAGKLLNQLESVQKGILFYQKLNSPQLAHFPIKTIAMLKFPFDAGSPLLEALEQDMKERGGSWWDFWTVPQLQANLSRSLSYFPQAEVFIFLDSRENSAWGKKILQGLFSPNS